MVLTDGSFIRNPAMQSVAMILMALILGSLALVLLLACTNVTMLFLSRSITRRGEIAIRLALGAGRARLIRMLALESFLYRCRRWPGEHLSGRPFSFSPLLSHRSGHGRGRLRHHWLCSCQFANY